MEIDVSFGTGDSEVTTDHGTIRSVVEEHDGRPAVDPNATESAAALRFQFPDDEEEGDSLEPIDWSRFFREFDGWDLALVYREGEPSYEFIGRKAAMLN